MLVDAFSDGGAAEPTEGQEVTVSASEADDLLAAYKAADGPATGGETTRSASDPTTSPAQSPPTARDPMESTGFDIHQGLSPAQAYTPLLNTTGELPRLFQFGERYQILETLGEGGMGRVYKALDLELDRPVALKTIRTEKTGPEALERFKQELILARKITHKNVIRIHDLGEFSGLKYFTMELVEGQSLGEMLKEKGKLTVAETIPIMRQILAGLSEAHSQDVVHRDLKPPNIMIDAEGGIRIMDFGIARTADSHTITGTSEMMGTPDYISPEQVKGETADAQSDLYSFGVILYELLTGETPFKGDTPISKIVSRIQTKPRPPRELNPEIPKYLERIILKCLEVDQEFRYHTADEILEDLELEQVDRTRWRKVRKAIARQSHWIAVACIVAAVGVGAWYVRTQGLEVAADDAPVTTIAILPFHNLSEAKDLEWMQSGIPEMLVTDISQLRQLRPLMPERVLQILSDLDKDRSSKWDEETLSVVSDIAGVDFVLTGQFARAGPSLRLDLNLREADTGVSSPLKVAGSSEDVFSLIDAVTDVVTTQLLPSSGDDTRPLADVSTSVLAAFLEYQQGLLQLRQGSNQSAIPFFERATELDPKFAMAQAKLAEAHYLSGNERLATQAAGIAESLSFEAQLPVAERYRIHAIGALVRNDPELALQSYRKLLELYPGDPSLLFSLAAALENLGNIPEAILAYTRTVEAQPQHTAALLGLGRTLVLSGRPSEAIERLRRALESDTFSGRNEALGMVYSILGVAYRDLSSYDASIDQLQQSLEYRRAAGDLSGVVTTLTNLGYVYITIGDIPAARSHLFEALDVAESLGSDTLVSFAAYTIGITYADSGSVEQAMEHYRRSLGIEWGRSNHSELAVRLDAIAEILRMQARLPEATVYTAQAKVHLAETNDPEETAFNLEVQGTVLLDLGRHTESLEAALQSLAVYKELESVRGVAQAQLRVSHVYQALGSYTDALDAARASIEGFTKLKMDRSEAEARISAANTLISMQQLDVAKEELSRSDLLLSRLVAPRQAALLRYVRGRLLAARGKQNLAAAELEDARAMAADCNDSVQELTAALELGRVLLTIAPAQGIELLVKTRDRAQQYQMAGHDARAALTLSRAYLDSGQTESAERMLNVARNLVVRLGLEQEGSAVLELENAVRNSRSESQPQAED